MQRIILCAIFCFSIANSQTSIKNKTKDISVVAFDYIHDVNNLFTSENITTAPFQKVTEPDLNWGKKNGFYWFKVSLTNNKFSEYAFNIPTIHIDSLKLYKKNNTSDLIYIGKSGNKITKAKTFNLHSHIATPLEKGMHTLYMHVYFKHEAYFPLQIEEETVINKNLPIFLLYYGFSLMMIVLNLILYLFFKEKVYLAYSFFLGIISLSLFYDDGLFAISFPYLMPYFDTIEIYIHWVTSIGATWFCFSFLNINIVMPQIKKWFIYVIIIAFILYTWTAISFNFTAYKLAGLSVYIVFISTWLLPIYFFKKYKQVRVLVVAYPLILFSSMAYYLLRVEGTQFIKITPNHIKIGGIIEIIFITISILYKFKILQKENAENKQLLLRYLTNLNIDLKQKKEKQLEIIAAENDLTKREKEVIEHLIQQKTNREIAESLFISVPTVKYHISNILMKLNVKDRMAVINKIVK